MSSEKIPEVLEGCRENQGSLVQVCEGWPGTVDAGTVGGDWDPVVFVSLSTFSGN